MHIKKMMRNYIDIKRIVCAGNFESREQRAIRLDYLIATRISSLQVTWTWTTSLSRSHRRHYWLRVGTYPRGRCAPTAMMTISMRATRPCRDAGAVRSGTLVRATYASAYTCATCRSERPSRLFSWTRVISHIQAWLKRKCDVRTFISCAFWLIRILRIFLQPSFPPFPSEV